MWRRGNALNFSVQIRRLGASPLRCPDLRLRQADCQMGEEAADVTCSDSDLKEPRPCVVILPPLSFSDILVSPQTRSW